MTLKILASAALAVLTLASAIPASATGERSAQGETKLARMLDGRVAGKPVRCLDAFQRRDMRVVDKTALVFRDGDTLYVNRPEGVSFLDWTDVPVFKLWSDELCSRDLAELRDRSTGMRGGTMVMSEFVPYRRRG